MKVLLLEDDADLASRIVLGFRRSGFAVDHVRTLEDADESVSISSYDVAVLDRMVPDGDSLGLLASWRSRSIHLPVLMLTARDTLQDRVEGFHHGADDYLVKPFAFVELAVRTRAIARRRSGRQAPVLRVGGIEMDVPRHTVTRDGVLLSLTAKEFGVLEMLLEAEGDVRSRSDLFEGCWDERTEPMSNVVDVVIGQLRRRLGEPDPIETVRGVGYRVAQ